MKIIVLLKMVPDVVEELEVAADGKALDTQFLRMIAEPRVQAALAEFVSRQDPMPYLPRPAAAMAKESV